MLRMLSTARRRASERGQSLTEIALGLVMIMILLAGTIEFGRLSLTYISLQSAAKNAAAYGSTAPYDLTGIRYRALGESLLDLIDWSVVAVTPSIIGQPCIGGSIRVDVEYDIPIITPFLGTLIGREAFPLRATVVEAILAPPCP